MRASCTKGLSEPLAVSQVTWVSGQKQQGAWPGLSATAPHLNSKARGALDPADLWAWPLRWGGLASRSEPSDPRPSDPRPFPRLSIPSEAQTWPRRLGTSPLSCCCTLCQPPFIFSSQLLGHLLQEGFLHPTAAASSAGFCVFLLLAAPHQTGVGSAWLGCAEQVREVQCLRAQSLDLGGSGGKGTGPACVSHPSPQSQAPWGCSCQFQEVDQVWGRESLSVRKVVR